jgi:signal transduction histidine kinase
MRLRGLERRISEIRLLVVPVVAAGALLADGYPDERELWALLTVAVFAAGSLTFFLLTRDDSEHASSHALVLGAQIFDTAAVAAFAFVFSFERGIPAQQLLYVALAAACVRFEIIGGLIVTAVSLPIVAVFEKLRTNYLDTAYSWRFVFFQVGIELVMALIVGLLVRQLALETSRAHDRAHEAEELRDELARRADLIDAANRCARALGSSLELPAAFGAFIRELRGLMRFDRVEIVLADEGKAHLMATAGRGADSGDTDPPSDARAPLDGTLLEEIVGSSQPVYRPRLNGAEYREEGDLLDLGLHSRLAAPLLSGARTIGMLSLMRTEADAFDEQELELLALLGRLVASAVQNIAAHEAERDRIEELRRLTAMRADFISLVSHELRTPLGAVIGAARTLQQRSAELTPEQQESLLELIAEETNRLTALVAEVLDTSRIDAGTFSYSFGDVDVGALVDDTVATASLGSNGTHIVAHVSDGVPYVRGDEARLRQVLTNLIDNAVKYSGSATEVEVSVRAAHEYVLVDVTDHGDGIAAEDHELIFERFGRVAGTASTPGTGLGLYIARSIVEAHGGELDVSSVPGRGATFTVALPLAEPQAA